MVVICRCSEGLETRKQAWASMACAGFSRNSIPRATVSPTMWSVSVEGFSGAVGRLSARDIWAINARAIVARSSESANRETEKVISGFLSKGLLSRSSTFRDKRTVPLEQFADLKSDYFSLAFKHLIEGDICVVEPFVNLLHADPQGICSVRYR